MVWMCRWAGLGCKGMHLDACPMVMLMLLGCDEYVRQSATRKSFGFEHTVLTPTFATSHRGVKTALKGRGQA